MPKDRLNLTIPPELIAEGKARADALGTSLSVVIERLLAQWLASGAGVPPKVEHTKAKKQTARA